MNHDMFRLQITAPKGRTRESSIPPGITTIGRQAGNDPMLKPTQAFCGHARLTRTEREGEIGDQDSTNWTRINGEKSAAQEPKILAEWNEIKMGGSRAVLHRIPVPQSGGCPMKAMGR